MRWFAVGADAVGIVAIGQQATGVVAIGQLATGVVAVGQLARGVVSFGQVSIGVTAWGQLAVGLLWAAGMLGVGALAGGPMLTLGLFGQVHPTRLRAGRAGGVVVRRPGSARGWALRLAVLAIVTTLVLLVALEPLRAALSGVEIDGIVGERPPLR